MIDEADVDLFSVSWEVGGSAAVVRAREPVVERIVAAARAENPAAGERLAAIGELDVLRLRR